jgi:hypothetical protein
MNVQPWAIYTPQPHPLAGVLGGIAPGVGSGQLAPQSLIGNLLSGLAGFAGQGLGGQIGYPQSGQFGYPQLNQGLGSFGSLLPFHAVPLVAQGAWSGQQPYIGGQWAPYGLNLLSGLASHTGQQIGGLPPFQAAPGLAAVS